MKNTFAKLLPVAFALLALAIAAGAELTWIF